MLHNFSKKDFKVNKNKIFIEVQNTEPFNEILISWNAKRPTDGHYKFDFNLFINNSWTNEIPYAKWTKDNQFFYTETLSLALKNLFQNNFATGFKIFIEAINGSDLNFIWGIHINTVNIQKHVVKSTHAKESYNLEVPKISQWKLNHNNPASLCSPASVTSVLNFFKKNINAVNFATNVNNNNIYGVWCLNVAEASCELSDKWDCYVTRFSTFDQIINLLKQNIPVVVSIQGPISGSTYPYKNGHILVVRGYDSISKKILCMDPGFHELNETYASYSLDEFMIAWGERRKGLAYVIKPASNTKN